MPMTYEDVKAQLFAIACTNPADTRSVAECSAATPRETTTFEYSENGGDVDFLWARVGNTVGTVWMSCC